MAPGDVSNGARVQSLWARLEAGEDFWTVVYEPFKRRELTRAELMALIDRGLRETRGSYRQLLHVFNLPAEHYKRFHAFLYSQQCNLPVGPYRKQAGERTRGFREARLMSRVFDGRSPERPDRCLRLNGRARGGSGEHWTC